MRKATLLAFAALALFAFGGFASSAMAEEADQNSPSILVLEGTPAELEGHFETHKGETPELITLSNKNTLSATRALALLKNCKAITGFPSDTNLCEPVVIDFNGVKQEKVNCRSENTKGEKDPIETVLATLDLHLAAATILPSGELVPMLLARLLGMSGLSGEENLKLVCGVIKIEVKGVFACLLLPGLKIIAAGGNIEILCKVNTTSHDPEEDMCEILCEPWGSGFPIGVLADLDGKTFEDAAELLHLLGTLNKSIFIDD